MSRFPFEEDPRHRFGEFEEWRGRYIFIGREACGDPVAPETVKRLPPMARRGRRRAVTPGTPARKRRHALTAVRGKR